MKYDVLSLKQPWATLLAHGRKTIEVRRWRTRFPRQLLIHAAHISDSRPEAWDQVPLELREEARQQLGGIVGVGWLDECKVYRNLVAFIADQASHLNDPSWFQPPQLFGLCFTKLRPVPFRRVPGFVRIFKVDLDDLEIPPPPVLHVAVGGLPPEDAELGENKRFAAVLQRFPPDSRSQLAGIVKRAQMGKTDSNKE